MRGLRAVALVAAVATCEALVAPRWSARQGFVSLRAKKSGGGGGFGKTETEAASAETVVPELEVDVPAAPEQKTLGAESRTDRQGRELLDVLDATPVMFPNDKDKLLNAIWNEPAAADIAEMRLPVTSTYKERLAALEAVVNEFDDDKLRRFVNVNMHIYSVAATKAISALKLNAQSRDDIEKAQLYKLLRRKLMAADGSLNTVLHVEMLERQTELGNVMGRTDVANFVGAHAAEVLPTWLVIKAVTSAWEDKYATETMEAQVAAEKRAVAGESKKLRVAEQKAVARAQATMMAMQGMAAAFRDEESFMKLLPIELRFLEATESEGVDGAKLGEFLDSFVEKEGADRDSLIVGLKRVQAKLDTVRLTRSFRLYSWYVRNVIEALGETDRTWETCREGEGKVTPYRILDGFSWERSPSVPTRNWEAVEENFKAQKEGKGGNPEYRGYGDASRDDDVNVLGVLGRAINPFQSAMDEQAVQEGKGAVGVNPDPLDRQLPMGGNWLHALGDDAQLDDEMPDYTQDELDAMVKEYDPEAEIRSKQREGDNQVDGSGAPPAA